MVLQASLAARPQHMALTILKIGFRPAGEGGGGGLQGSTNCRGHILIMGLVVQVSLVAGQQNMAQTMLKTGLLCRPGELQGSTKYRGPVLIMGLVVQAS